MTIKQRSVLLFLAASMMLFAFALFFTPSAEALCALPPEVGSWRNHDANTRSVTRAEIDLVCNDVSHNGAPVDIYYTVKLYGSCHPTDCVWETLRGEKDDNGWVRATYSLGWATKSIWIKKYDNGWLRVYVWTDYHDGRTDRSSNDWMRVAP